MFKNRTFVLLMLVLLAFSIVGPVSAAPSLQDIFTSTPTETTEQSSTPTDVVVPTEIATETATETETATSTLTPEPTSTSTTAPEATATVTPTLTATSTASSSATANQEDSNIGIAAGTSTSSPTPTTPAGFSKIYPWNNTTGLALTTITLSWKARSPSPEKYRYCIDTSNNSVCDAAGGWTSAFGTSVALTNFAANTTYYWHVQAVICSTCVPKTFEDTNGGTWWAFTTAGSATPTPTLTPTTTLTRTPTSTKTPTPTAVVFTISGNTGIGGVTVSYTDGTLKSVASSGNGNYSITVSDGWTGTVTVARAGYTFNPNYTNYTNVSLNLTNQNYSPTQTVRSISGKVNDIGVALSFYDGAGQTAFSDSSGNYTILVPDGWTGTVTPAKSGVTFSPVSYNYSTAVTTNLTGQDYTPTLSITSTSGQDGWILESSENSSVGGSLSASQTILVAGDDALNRQYRSIVSFNTAGLPNSAVIQTSLLKVKQYGTVVGTNPFTILSRLYVDIAKGSFGTISLALGDFSATATATKVGYFNTTPVSGWYTSTLNATGNSTLNKTGLTQLRLYFLSGDNNDQGADYIKFSSGEATYKPTLVITYTMP